MLKDIVKVFKKMVHITGIILVACIFIGAVYLLYHEVSKYSLVELQVSVESIPYWSLFLSIILTTLNYIILIGYDWLALKGIHKRLPLKKVALVSFVGQAVSYNFGALLGGSTIRYRFYSSWRFSPMEIVKLVLMLAITFWVGAFGLAGIIFILAPPVITPDLAAYFPSEDIRPLGIILFSLAAAYLITCKFIHKSVHIFGKEFSFPPFKIALAQAVVASADLVAAAACLYILLPEDAGISFIQFLPTYLMAMVAVVLTHVPGGAGVLEVVVIHLTNAAPQAILAALLCFRVIYYLIPLIIAAVVYLVYEVNQQTQENIKLLTKMWRYLKIHIPIIISVIIFTTGIVLCFLAVLPVHYHKVHLLGMLLPNWMIELGGIITGVVSIFLFFFSVGIKYKRKYILYYTLVLLFIGCIGVLTSTLNFFISGFLIILIVLLFCTKKYFYIKSSIWKIHFNLRWVITSLSIVICSAGLGFSIRHIDVTNIHWLTFVYFKDGHKLLHILFGECIIISMLLLKYIQTHSGQKVRKKRSVSMR